MRRSRYNVARVAWSEPGAQPEPRIRIWAGNFFVTIPFEHARQIVDKVHDLADERDQELREKEKK